MSAPLPARSRRRSPSRALAGAAALALAALHPQDGPDADVALAIGPERVTLSVTVNVAYADVVLDVAREREELVDPVEYEAYHEALYEHLAETVTVRIDGIEVAPRDGGFQAVEPDYSLLPLFPRTGLRGLQKLGVELVYPVKAPPERVALAWGVFPPDLAIADAEGNAPPLVVRPRISAAGTTTTVELTEEEPEHVWHGTTEVPDRMLAVPAPPPAATVALPLASAALALLALAGGLAALAARSLRAVGLGALVLCAGLAWVARGAARVEVRAPWLAGPRLPSPEEALAVFRPLHANIYRAFDYDEEERVYDALARSVTGELLAELYDEVYRGLVLQDEGGAVSRVQAVALEEAEVEEIGVLPAPEGAGPAAPSFRVRARWEVDGAVFHWGHAHWRTNEYVARYLVRGTPDGWRIAGSRVLEQRRVAAGTGDRPPERSRSAGPESAGGASDQDAAAEPPSAPPAPPPRPPDLPEEL